MTGLLIATSWFGVGSSSFDWQAAMIVGAVVVVAVVVILTAAIATPVIAIQAGATIMGTAAATAAISIATGFVGGTVAGFYWGRAGDIKHKEQVDRIARISNQLDIYFEPSVSDPMRAADFACTMVIYEESDLLSRPPTVTTAKVPIKGADAKDFYDQIEQRLKVWLEKPVEGDRRGEARKVMVYMIPFPGQGAYDRLREMTERPGVVRSVITRTEGGWTPAIHGLIGRAVP